MKLLLDAMYTPAIAEQLRRRGHDATAARQDERLANLSDEALFAAAQVAGRSVVTDNLDDFLEIDGRYRQRGEEHHGLILTTNRRFGRGHPGHIGHLVLALDALLREDVERIPGWVHWLT